MFHHVHTYCIPSIVELHKNLDKQHMIMNRRKRVPAKESRVFDNVVPSDDASFSTEHEITTMDTEVSLPMTEECMFL